MKDIAKDTGTSVSGVKRVLGIIARLQAAAIAAGPLL